MDSTTEARKRFNQIAGGQDQARKVIEAAMLGYKAKKVNFEPDRLMREATLPLDHGLNPEKANKLRLEVRRDLRRTSREILSEYARIANVSLGDWPVYHESDLISPEVRDAIG